MLYQSTRDPAHKKYQAAEVIKMGLAPDGGLFIPETIPALTAFTIAASVSLRRKGLTRVGFFIQLIGPALFFLMIALETAL